MIIITPTLIIQAALVAASVVYQSQKASKARKAARDAAEKRKGFDLIVDGEVSTPMVVYGRFKIGGTIAWRNVSSSFQYTTPNSNKVFIAGTYDSPSSAYNYYNSSGILATASKLLVKGSQLTSTKNGKLNEYMYYQQAICLGPINAAYDIIVNDSMSLNDPALVGSFPDKDDRTTSEKGALRIDVHYGATPTSDAILTNNFSQRSTAVFTDLAYFSAVAKLNRDNPQFTGIPQTQIIGEGRLVRTISGGILSVGKTYSNSPPLVLADYLLEFKKVLPEEINLPSFEACVTKCARVVISNAKVGGKIWQPEDGSRFVTTRNIPLYECNIGLDTTINHRENIEKILDTMGDARLIWSQGKYKLQMQAPESNAAIELSGELTDEDILIGSQIDINWPDSSFRLNYATVRFRDESLDFEENSVSWPPKTSSTVLRGVGSTLYAAASGWADDEPFRKLLNLYGVWDGATNSCSMNWKYVTKTTGTQTLSLSVDDDCTISINGGATVSRGYGSVHTLTFSSTANSVVTIAVTATNTGFLKGFAAKVVDPSNIIPWTSRSPAYTDFITVVNSSTVYDTFKTEDNGIPLESDVFAEGITDYYHALAKAEEMVRVSRSAFKINFKHIIKDRYYEPGDIIKLNFDDINLVDTFVKVDESKLSDDQSCEIEATRFDYTQLAWNVTDNSYVTARNVYDYGNDRPERITFENSYDLINRSAGRVSWDLVPDGRVIGYKIYASRSPTVDAFGRPVFEEMGVSTTNTFDLPPLDFKYGFVGVRAMTQTSLSDMTMSDPVIFNLPTVEWIDVVGDKKPGDYATRGPNMVMPLNQWIRGANTYGTIANGKFGSEALNLQGTGDYPRNPFAIPIEPGKVYQTRFWARTTPGNTGYLYFSLRQFLDEGITPGPDNGGRDPYAVGVTPATHEGAFGVNGWGEYTFIWTAAEWQVGAKYVIPEFLDNYPVALTGQWDIQNMVMQDITESYIATNLAIDAQADATAAAAAASAATAEIVNISSDSVLAKVEKPPIILNYSTITGEQAGIDAQATALGITTEKTNYDTSITDLTTYLGTLSPAWNDNSVNTPIVGTTFRSKFNDVYLSRQVLLNKIAQIASERANWSNVSGAGKPSDYATSDLSLIAGGACEIQGNTLSKQSPSSSMWDSQVYSKDGYSGGAYASVQVSALGQYTMFGLATNPTFDASYGAIEHAIYNDNTFRVYESGFNVYNGVSLSAGDILTVLFDGYNVKYLRNGVVQYTSTIHPASNTTFYFDSTFYSPGARLDKVRFGPMSSVRDIITQQMAADAASGLDASYSSTPIALNTTIYTDVANIAYTPSGYNDITVNGGGIININAGGSSAGGVQVYMSTYDLAGPTNIGILLWEGKTTTTSLIASFPWIAPEHTFTPSNLSAQGSSISLKCVLTGGMIGITASSSENSISIKERKR